MSTLSPWARARRAAYALMVASVLLSPVVGVGTWWYLHLPETCADGEQNQGERGVDCGGPCPRACAADVQPVTVAWVRPVRVRAGTYHAVAYLINRNRQQFARDIPYRITLYDERGTILAVGGGTFTLPPQQVVVVFHPNLATGKGIPTRATFEYAPPHTWWQVRGAYRLPEVGEVYRQEEGRPRVGAVLSNPDPAYAITDVEAYALVFDRNDTLIAASHTVVQRIPPRGRVPVVFSWPEPWVRPAGRVEVVVARPALFADLPWLER